MSSNLNGATKRNARDGFIESACGSFYWALAIILLTLLSYAIVDMLAWFLVLLALVALAGLYRNYSRLLSAEEQIAINIFTLKREYRSSSILGMASGVLMTGYWLTLIATARTTDAAASLVGQLIAPVLAVLFERSILPANQRTWSALALIMLALCCCIASAAIFLIYIEGNQFVFATIVDQAWLFIPSIVALLPTMLLMFAEKIDGADKRKEEVAKAVFRLREYVGTALFSAIVAGFGATVWVQKLLTAGHAHSDVLLGFDFPVWLLVVIFVLAGWGIGSLVVGATLYYDNVRRCFGTAGAVALETLDPYVATLASALLFAIFVWPVQLLSKVLTVEEWGIAKVMLSKIFDPSKYSLVSSLIGGALGTTLIAIAAGLLFLAWKLTRKEN